MIRESNSVEMSKCIYTRHTFARLRYAKDDGLPAFYSPDFLVRTEESVYLVETKAQAQTIHPNVQRKLKAALTCVVYEWQGKGARLAELLAYARLRPLASTALQQALI